VSFFLKKVLWLLFLGGGGGPWGWRARCRRFEMGSLKNYLTPNEFVAQGKVFRVMGQLECPIAFIFTGVSTWA